MNIGFNALRAMGVLERKMQVRLRRLQQSCHQIIAHDKTGKADTSDPQYMTNLHQIALLKEFIDDLKTLKDATKSMDESKKVHDVLLSEIEQENNLLK